MASSMKVYRVKQTLWHQKPLLYGDFLKVMRLLKDRWGKLGADRETLVAWVDELESSGLLPQLVDIVLEPHEPTRLHRAWNRFWMKRGGVGRPIAYHMETGAVALVVVDFFLLNGSWVISLLNTKLGSASPFSKRMTLAEGITTWMRFSTGTQVGTTSSLADLLLSQRSASSGGNSSQP